MTFGFISSRFNYHYLMVEMAMAEHNKIHDARLARYQNEVRPIHVFPSDYMDAMWGVDKLDTPPVHRKMAIFGTGRCGTTYISKVMNAIGVDIPHGKMGQDGTTGHYFMVDHHWYPVITYQTEDVAYIGERASDYIFDKVVIMVREPLAAIRSLAIFMGKIDENFLESTGIVPHGMFAKHSNPMWRGMVIYHFLNHFLLDSFPDAYLLHLENVHTEWYGLLEYLGLSQTKLPDIPPQNRMGEIQFSPQERQIRNIYGEEIFMAGYRAHPKPLTYREMNRIDRVISSDIAELAGFLGYTGEDHV